MKNSDNILTKEGYMLRWLHYVGKGHNHRTAYEKIEEELMQLYGVNRYSSFESFKRARYYYHQIKTK